MIETVLFPPLPQWMVSGAPGLPGDPAARPVVALGLRGDRGPVTILALPMVEGSALEVRRTLASATLRPVQVYIYKVYII